MASDAAFHQPPSESLYRSQGHLKGQVLQEHRSLEEPCFMPFGHCDLFEPWEQRSRARQLSRGAGLHPSMVGAAPSRAASTVLRDPVLLSSLLPLFVFFTSAPNFSGAVRTAAGSPSPAPLIFLGSHPQTPPVLGSRLGAHSALSLLPKPDGFLFLHFEIGPSKIAHTHR